MSHISMSVRRTNMTSHQVYDVSVLDTVDVWGQPISSVGGRAHRSGIDSPVCPLFDEARGGSIKISRDEEAVFYPFQHPIMTNLTAYPVLICRCCIAVLDRRGISNTLISYPIISKV